MMNMLRCSPQEMPKKPSRRRRVIGCGLQRHAVSNEDEPKEKHHVNVSLYAGGVFTFSTLGRRQIEKILSMLACPDERQKLCRKDGANTLMSIIKKRISAVYKKEIPDENAKIHLYCG